MGWDDNGLPTERRVQNYFHVKCEPHVAYEAGLALPMADDAARKQPARRVSRANFIELCLALTAEDEKAFKALWQRLGLSIDWALEYSTISAARAAPGAVELPRPLPQGPGLPGRGADAVGRGLPHRRRAGRGRGPPAARRLPRRALRGRGRRLVRDRDHAAGAAARLRRRRGAPGRRALPAAVRQARDHAALPRAGADLPERARRAREGHRHPDGVHVRRRDRRRSGGASRSWRCGRSSAATAGWCRPTSAATATRASTRRRPSALRRAGRQDRARGAEEHRRAAARARRLGAGRRPAAARLRAAADRAPGQVLREGRPAARVHHHAPVVRAHPRAQAGAGRGGREGAVAPRLHGPALPQLDREPEPRLVHQPPALLRRAVPGLVRGERGRHDRLRAAARWPTRRACRSTRRATCRRATARRSATSRAASAAKRTSSTPGSPPR